MPAERRELAAGAAIRSAVGFGNMWRFSYMTAENGGAAFVVLYLAMTLFVGFPVMLTELTVGRSSRRSPAGRSAKGVNSPPK